MEIFIVFSLQRVIQVTKNKRTIDETSFKAPKPKMEKTHEAFMYIYIYQAYQSDLLSVLSLNERVISKDSQKMQSGVLLMSFVLAE